MRQATINRETAETKISLTLCLDGEGKSEIRTGCGFLDHMLTLFAGHGDFTLEIDCEGDTEVDYHHTVEDIGIVLGKAFREALGDMKGITRYGSIILPMDESLILAAADISGRGHLSYSLDIPTEKVGDFDTELVKEFFLAFVRNADITLHIKKLDGENSHHIIEGAFKAFARTMKQAVKTDEKNRDKIPSTKGVL
ncbi:MAG: imidazoleglycerol-phosphate dehydratase HisB [Ruminococcaceae bacterium]|nr:imidazoleglycerol-phosphate dehydratase HisB [Oscillospiraceae bacterium]MBQ9914260.1 imidazoleglycerol-phosphate dehydratase HisB [Clostridia bacterium]